MTVHLDALDVELARLDALIEAEIRRLRARYELSLDEFRGLYVTDERVEALLRARSDEPRLVPDISEARAADQESRWHQLAVSLDLTDDERDLFLVVVAPELSPKYETLYAYLNDDVTRRWPTLDLAIRLLARDPSHRTRLRGLLLPGSKMPASGAIDIAAATAHEPRLRRIVTHALPLGDWIQGLPYADDRLSGIASVAGPQALFPDEALPFSSRPVLEGVVGRLRRRAASPPVVIVSADAAEASFIAQGLFVRAERRCLVVDLTALREAPSPIDVATAATLAQRILGLGIVAWPLDALVDADRRVVSSVLPAIRRLASWAPGIVFGSGPGVRVQEVLGDPSVIEIHLPESTVRERAAAWGFAFAGGSEGRPPLPQEVIDALADRFIFGADRVLRATNAARQAASLDGAIEPSSTHAFVAARAVSVADANGTTRMVATDFGWDDLILPIETKTRLTDIVHAIERRNIVLDQWGLARRAGGSRGVKVMFAGPSGTGKTMAAAILAKQLELDVHRLELGAVVSKYIGETEKNLDRAFEATRRSNAVLFIDEADALLGKRSEVKDAHDRYSNIEIAYLLQKMDEHDGVVIVATNLARNIDESFSRRMQYVVEFPLPDAVGREQLWRGMLPSAAPVSADVDFAYLGRQFELAGGDIRNVVLDAAFHAAHDGGSITLGHLLQAVARQYLKNGRVLTRTEFREHYRLLTEVDLATPAESSAAALRTS